MGASGASDESSNLSRATNFVYPKGDFSVFFSRKDWFYPTYRKAHISYFIPRFEYALWFREIDGAGFLVTLRAISLPQRAIITKIWD
jgi:hypothetical protein